MHDMVAIGRILFKLIIAISLGLLIVLITQEIEANNIAAVWAQAGFPDLRAPHHNHFLAKVYACIGSSFLSLGVLIGLFSNEG